MNEYVKLWIIRFEGTLTQGPNAGTSYTFATSFGGGTFDSLEKAQAQLRQYRELEPALAYRICTRQWVGGKRGRFHEEVVA